MPDLEKTTRREFLRKVGGWTVGTAVSVPVMSSTIFGSAFGVVYLTTDIDEVVSDEFNQHALAVEEGTVLKKTIANNPYILYGVEHSKRLTKKNKPTMERLVRESSVVVIESPSYGSYVPDNTAFYDGERYFNTIVHLCEQYDKPLITLDSISIPGLLVESGVGILGAFYATKHAYNIMTKNNTKGESIKAMAKTGVGTYFFLSALFPSLALKIAIKETALKENLNSTFTTEQLYLSHISDQRNLQLLDRLERLPGLLKKEGIEVDKNIFATFGGAHINGVDYYLNHPTMRWIKSKMHRVTYDLIDNNEIALYTSKNGAWKKKVLRS